MTVEETEKLFELLAIYKPKSPNAKDRQLMKAWALVLDPYPAAEVREAVAAYFREKNYWPDVTEIAVRCPSPPPKVETMFRHGKERDDAIFRQWEDICRRRRADGLPATITEALEVGWSLMEWEKELERGGLDCPPEWRRKT